MAIDKKAQREWNLYRKKTKGMEQMHKAHFMEMWHPGAKYKGDRTSKLVKNLRSSGTSWKDIYKLSRG